MSNDITPPLGQPLAPPLWEMGEYPFQDFCQAVWRTEGVDCQLYGVRGQKQKGIDLKTFGQPADGGSVGQCKCYEVFEAADLRKAVEEFTEHLAFWRDQKIKILRLYVASSCSHTKVQDEYAKHKDLLARDDISLQLLDNRALAVQLRNEPTIVSRFCGDAWVKNICGAGAMTLAPNAVLATAMHLTDNGEIFRAWEEDRNKELEALRERIREGDGDSVYEEVLGVVASPDWGRFSAKLRGVSLRILAAMDCNRLEGEKAANWITKAKAEDPSADYQVIEAHYLAITQDRTAAYVRLNPPLSVHAWNLRLSLLLGEGKFSEILDAFANSPFELTPESHRLKASACLALEQVEDAVVFADKALAGAPKWLATRSTAAAVNYLSIVSPRFHAWRQIEWPVPPDAEFVRHDTVALGRLRQATALFQDLQKDPLNEFVRSNLEIWLLATYALNPEARANAESYSRSLLEDNPGNFRAVMWAISRHLPFDIARVRPAVERAVANAPSMAAVITLVELAGLANDAAGGKAILTTYRSTFADSSALSEWRLLMIQMLAHSGAMEEAQSLLAEETHPEARWDIRQMLAEIRVKNGGPAAEMSDELERIYEESRNPHRLFRAAEAKLQAGKPEWVLEHQDDLLNSFPGTETIRVILFANFQTSQFAQVVEVLDANWQVFPVAGPPDELVRMKVRALRLTGRLNEALELAKSRRLGAGHRDNTLELFHLQIAMADISGAAATAQGILPLQDVDVSDLLQICRSLTPFNQQMAARFWKKATEAQVLTDPEIVSAVEIGFCLGLDSALAPLMQQFQRILASGSGLVYAVPLQEVNQLQQNEVQRLGEANRDYNRRMLPIHVTGEALHCSMGFLYHIMLRNNAAANTPLRSAPLLTRSGASDLKAPAVLRGKTLVVDIISLILARHLDILDLVEQHLGTLAISSWVPVSLQKQIHDASSHQPALAKPRNQVYQLLAQGLIKRLVPMWPQPSLNEERVKQMGEEWCSRIAQVQKEGGLFVTYFPLTAQLGERHILSLSAEELQTIIPIGSFLNALQTAGVLSSSDITKCNRAFGIEAQLAGSPRSIESQQIVLLESVIAEGLARAEVLDKVVSFCQLRVSASSAILIENQHAESQSRGELAEWLKNLAEHVSTSIQSGKYKTFSEPPGNGDASRFSQHPDLGCFHDLIPVQFRQERITWCDDRLVTSHKTTDVGPIVGVCEVLEALLNEGAITKDLYYAKLYELRRSNVRYLPTTPEEILFQIQSATFNSGRLQETAELAALRMSLAAALADTPRLQLPGTEETDPRLPIGDLPWILQTNRASFEALQVIWAESEFDVAVTRSEWIIDALIFDLGALRDLHRPELGSRDVAEFYFLNILEWVLVAFRQKTTFLSDREGDSRRRVFFRWMYERVIVSMLRVNPGAEMALGRSLGTALTQVMTVGRSVGMTQRQASLSALGILLDLPVVLQPLVEVPQFLKDEFAVEKGQVVVEVGDTTFHYPHFWRSMAEAVNGREAQLQSLEGVTCTMTPKDSLPLGHAVTLRRPNETDLVSTSENNPILNEDIALRMRFLEDLPYFEDLAPESKKALISEIAAISDPLGRLERLTSVLQQKSAYYYKTLTEQLGQNQPFPPDELFPYNPDLLLEFTHCQKDEPIDWNSHSANLIARLGLAQALRRLVLVPRQLNPDVVDQITDLDDIAFISLIQGMEEGMAAPACRIHIFAILANKAAKSALWTGNAQDFVTAYLSSKPEPSFIAFHAILSFCFRSLEQHPEAALWPVDVFLTAAWSHAAQLYNAQKGAGASDETIKDRFRREISKLLSRLIGRCEAAFADAASPRFVTWDNLLCRGLGSILSSLPNTVVESIRPAKQQIKEAISDQDEDVVAFGTLLGETQTRSNALQSYLGGEWLPPLATLVADRTAWLFQEPRAYALARLQEVEADCGNTVAWGELWMIFRMAPIYPDLKDRMLELLGRVQLSSLLQAKAEDALYGIHFLCSQASHTASPEILNLFRNELVRCANFCQEMRDKNQAFASDKKSFEKIVWSVIQAAQYLELRTPLTDEPAPFCALMNRMIQVCPPIGTVLRQRLGGSPPAMPFELNRGLWPFYMRLRAAP